MRLFGVPIFPSFRAGAQRPDGPATPRRPVGRVGDRFQAGQTLAEQSPWRAGLASVESWPFAGLADRYRDSRESGAHGDTAPGAADASLLWPLAVWSAISAERTNWKPRTYPLSTYLAGLEPSGRSGRRIDSLDTMPLWALNARLTL